MPLQHARPASVVKPDLRAAPKPRAVKPLRRESAGTLPLRASSCPLRQFDTVIAASDFASIGHAPPDENAFR